MGERFEVRGVLEGFYGRPWSWLERERMVNFMGDHGFNLYVYCPKNDPIHRNQWREPHLPEEVERFGELAERAERRGVEFVFGVSPLHFHYTRPSEFETMWSKIEALYKAGVRSFSILLDDMPSRLRYPEDQARFGSLAAAQAWVVNAVLERLEATGEWKRLMFCPTEYHGMGTSAYLRTLGERLDPRVEVFWTGRKICSPTLSAADAKVVSATLKRPVVYWDNYPVNDLDMRFQAHLRPIRGREAALAGAVKGIVVAAGLQPEAHKIPLYTYSRYLLDPERYEPEAAWADALLDVCLDPQDAAAVATLGDLSGHSILEKRRVDRLTPRLQEFWRRWGGVPNSAEPVSAEVSPDERRAAIAELEVEFGRLGRAADRLQGFMVNRSLQNDLQPWSRKLAGWVEVGQLALTVLRTALADPRHHRLPALRRETLARIYATRENFAWVAGDGIDLFARRCLWAAEALASEAGQEPVPAREPVPVGANPAD